MKNLVPAIFGLFLMSILVSSCSKSTDTATAPKEQVVVGRWNINRMQLRIYYGGVFSKDTIVAQTPMPENFIQFDAAGNFQYRFNTTAIDAGTYQFKGADSIIAISPIRTYRWKILTLYSYLFTMMNTSSSEGAYPGATVETYFTLVH